MTLTQRDQIKYIEDHGHMATPKGDHMLTMVCLDNLGWSHFEDIPALWTRVRDWLGY